MIRLMWGCSLLEHPRVPDKVQRATLRRRAGTQAAQIALR